jgi:ribosome recycling factor
LIEEGKIAIRNIRRDGIQQLNNIGKEKTVSEDIIKDNEQEVQKITDSFINNLNSIQVEKEKELLEV